VPERKVPVFDSSVLADHISSINPVALNLVLSCHKSGILSDIEVKAQTTGQMLKTPFQERLKKFDYLSFDPHEIQFFEVRLSFANMGLGIDSSLTFPSLLMVWTRNSVRSLPDEYTG